MMSHAQILPAYALSLPHRVLVEQRFLLSLSSTAELSLSTDSNMSTADGITYAATPPMNLIQDPDQSPQAVVLVAITAVCFPLASIISLIRLYTRSRISGKVSVDDCMFCLAPVLVITGEYVFKD